MILCPSYGWLKDGLWSRRGIIFLVCRRVSESQQSSIIIGYHAYLSKQLCVLSLIQFQGCRHRHLYLQGNYILIHCFNLKKLRLVRLFYRLSTLLKVSTDFWTEEQRHAVEIILTIYLNALHNALHYWHFSLDIWGIYQTCILFFIVLDFDWL